MKNLIVMLVLLSGLSTISCFTGNSGTIAVDSVRYIDANQAEGEFPA